MPWRERYRVSSRAYSPLNAPFLEQGAPASTTLRARLQGVARCGTMPHDEACAHTVSDVVPRRSCCFRIGMESSHETLGRTDVGPERCGTFRLYCASCHGTSGKGDGPLASSMKIPPADLTQIGKETAALSSSRACLAND